MAAVLLISGFTADQKHPIIGQLGIIGKKGTEYETNSFVGHFDFGRRRLY
jgi:hypothetical protein